MVHILLAHEGLLWHCHKAHGQDVLWINFRLWELDDSSCPFYSCAAKRAASTGTYVHFQLYPIQAASIFLGYI